MTVEEFRRRRGLVYCARCDSYHPKGRCPFIPMTTARKRTALGQYAPRRDGIDAWGGA